MLGTKPRFSIRPVRAQLLSHLFSLSIAIFKMPLLFKNKQTAPTRTPLAQLVSLVNSSVPGKINTNLPKLFQKIEKGGDLTTHLWSWQTSKPDRKIHQKSIKLSLTILYHEHTEKNVLNKMSMSHETTTDKMIICFSQVRLYQNAGGFDT
jgi:hypothetical protein